MTSQTFSSHCLIFIIQKTHLVSLFILKYNVIHLLKKLIHDFLSTDEKKKIVQKQT